MLILVRQPTIRKPLDPQIRAILVERGERRMGIALIGSPTPLVDNSTVKRVQIDTSLFASLTMSGWMTTSIESGISGDIAVMERV